MDLRQSKEFAQYIKLSGWIVEKLDRCYVYLRKLPLTPPLIMKIQYPEPPIPFEKIEKLAKKYKPLQIQIQPLKVEPGFKKYGYKLGGGGHVTKTIQIDLTQSEKQILAQIKKDGRYGIRKAEKETVQIIKVKEMKPSASFVAALLHRRWSCGDKCRLAADEIEQFHQAWKKSVSWRRYVPSLKTLTRLKKAFGKKAVFLLAPSLGGTIILMTDKTTYYYYAFTSKEGRKKFAQYLLVWEAIKLAKKKGCEIFDFEGIYDERFPIKAWKGFSHFKKSFGGKEVEYPGCFTKSRLHI